MWSQQSKRIERSEIGAPGEFDAFSDDELERMLVERLNALGLKRWRENARHRKRSPDTDFLLAAAANSLTGSATECPLSDPQ